MSSSGTPYLVLYDGLCALCNRSVRFLLEIDRHRRLSFAPLQGETARAILARHPKAAATDSLIFVRDVASEIERVTSESSGVLESLAVIGGIWRAVSWLRVVPRPLRDLVYRSVARNRYDWFGKLDACPLPPPEVRDRFLP